MPAYLCHNRREPLGEVLPVIATDRNHARYHAALVLECTYLDIIARVDRTDYQAEETAWLAQIGTEEPW